MIVSMAGLLLVAGVAASANGLVPVIGMYARSWADQADGAAFPSHDAAFAANGMTSAFDSFYRAHTIGAGINVLVVAAPIDGDA